jgi:hypothetical protein
MIVEMTVPTTAPPIADILAERGLVPRAHREPSAGGAQLVRGSRGSTR